MKLAKAIPKGQRLLLLILICLSQCFAREHHCSSPELSKYVQHAGTFTHNFAKVVGLQGILDAQAPKHLRSVRDFTATGQTHRGR